MASSSVSVDPHHAARIREPTGPWSTSTPSLDPEPTPQHYVPWAYKWPPPWWPNPLLQSVGSDTPRPSRSPGLGVDSRTRDTQMLDRPLLTERAFPQRSTTTTAYMSLLNWNAGVLNRNNTLINLLCDNWMLLLLQEASPTLGEALAASRGVCWSGAPYACEKCLAVLAGASGAKFLSPTYGLNFDGQIIRPHKVGKEVNDLLQHGSTL